MDPTTHYDTNSDPADEADSQTSLVNRRSVLASTGVVAAAAVTGAGISLAQQTSTTIELGGETPGWQGRVPSSIDGETNPTLTLQEGTTYQLTWTNLDGAAHNVVILDSSGNQLERTEIMTAEGESQTLEFTATAEMAEYLCEVHPGSMVGDIEISSGGQTQTENESDEPAAGQNQVNESDVSVNDTGNETLPNDWNASGNYNTSEIEAEPGNQSGETESLNISANDPGVDVSNITINSSEDEGINGNATVTTDQTDDDGREGGGNGKAKSGNGKAKSGTGDKGNNSA